MATLLRSARVALLALATATPAFAQDAVPKSEPAAPAGGDTDVIDFIYPGDFAKVLQRAKQQHRPIVIKGVAFGVDAEGAQCATKGHW